MNLGSRLRSRRYRALVYITGMALAGSGLFGGLLAVTGNVAKYVPGASWSVAWFALIFYVSWWVVYYGFSAEPDEVIVDADDPDVEVPDHSVITLRTFLKFTTPRGRLTSGGESLAEKAGNTMQAVGGILGLSLLVFSITVQFLFDRSLRPIYRDIFFGVLSLQLFAIASLLIAIDSLDSTMNEFYQEDLRAHRLRRDFYDRGIVLYYNGLIVLVLSMLLLTMVVQPLVTIFGVFIFIVFGYDYWFGYTDVDD